jgi:hypothetical protein
MYLSVRPVSRGVKLDARVFTTRFEQLLGYERRDDLDEEFES